MKLKAELIKLLPLLFIVLSACSSQKAEEIRPNVLFILADDFGYHDLSDGK